MSPELEAELRAAFKDTGTSVMPPGNLVNRVRQAVRRKLAMGAVAALVVVAAAAYLTSSLVTGTGHSDVSRGKGHNRSAHVVVRLAAGQNIDAMAVSGRYLYLATDTGGQAPYVLATFNRATGRRILQVANVPGEPARLSIGPGNSVWLTFSTNGISGACGTWLLTANLDQMSARMNTCSLALLPIGRDTALMQVRSGWLAKVAMPPPGQSGRETVEPYGRVGSSTVVALAKAGTHVAALVTNDQGDYRIVIAGHSGLSFGGGSGPLAVSETAEANGLWVVTGPTAEGSGPLVRLSDTLRPGTPAAIRANPILQQSEKVWSAGHTVWVAADSATHQLVCFTYRSAPGKVATVPVRGQVATLAAEGHSVYVTIAGGDVSDVFAYTIPPACR